MTSAPLSLDSDDHKQHAHSHLRSAEVILDAGEGGWAVTAAFYSSFHVMRAAILADPIWDQGPTALSKVNPNLSMDCRYASHHQGNAKRGRGPGVREIVRWLYPEYNSRYSLLHGASITVRYEQGGSNLPSPFEDYLDQARTLLEALDAGKIARG